MNGQIRITLRSDLCAASGDGFSLAIDTDVCTDRYGFPYIPSRRLKGVMRKAAEYIGCEKISKIFGESGNKESGSLKLSNADLEDYHELVSEIADKNIIAEKITTLFSSVKASTAIEIDTAKEESLRFMRVVNKYSPFDDRELVFCADVEIDDQYKESIERICKAVRNIGFKRNRGFGAVGCTFEKTDVNKYNTENYTFNDTENYRIDYTIKLDSPLMMTGASGSETADHINGTAVLGAFAGKYLKSYVASDSDFEDIFLKQCVKFSDLYITSDGKVSVPAPTVLGKVKGKSEIEFVYDREQDAAMVKPFKTGYVAEAKELKPETETIYHNGGAVDEAGNDKSLYMQTVLSEGQLFSGYIEGSGKYLKKIYPLFAERIFRFGRSRTAQYSQCSLIYCKPKEIEKEKVKASGEMYAVFASDVLLLDENTAGYTTDFEKLKSAFKSIYPQMKINKERSSLRYNAVTGYVSVGRYKKSHIRAFAAGSTVVFDVDVPVEMDKEIYIGEKQGEGFGRIMICDRDGLFKLGSNIDVENKDNEKNTKKLTALLDKNKRTEGMRMSALKFAEANKEALVGLNSAFVGRVALMISQAESFDAESDPQNLMKRIDSVKDQTKREKAIDIINKVKKHENGFKDCWREYLTIVFTAAKYYIKERG